VMKAVLSLQHRRIPRSLHFSRPNPHVPWDEIPVRVADVALPWERNGHPRRAGVSSFAMSGSNAHLILEEAPEVVQRAAQEASSYLLPLSAKSSAALAALALSYASYLAAPGDGARLADIVYTASARRVHREHRLAIAGRTREDFAAALLAFAHGEQPIASGETPKSSAPPAGVAHGQVPSEGRPTLVFVFADLGSQWPGMGRQLLAEEPVFRSKIAECEALLRRHVAWSLLSALSAPEELSRLAEPGVAQLALFAVQVALAELLKSWGVTPDAVLGCGVGEVAAAHVAGALSLEEGVRLAAWRCRITQGPTEPGATAEGVGQVETGRATVPIFSTVTGAAIEGESLDDAYWGRNVREPALLARAVESAFGAGHRLLLQVGPRPALSTHPDALKAEGHTLATLRRNSDERVGMLQALGALYARGLDVAWKELFPGGGRCVALPTYRWQRERYWIEASESEEVEREPPTNRGGHPLLGRIFEPANRRGVHYWEQWVSVADLPYLADHRVRGDIVFPGAGFVEMALAAATEVFGEGGFVLEDLTFEWMLSLADGERRRVQVSLVDEQGYSSIEVSSRNEASREWARHAVVKARSAVEDTDEGWESPRRTRERCPVEVEGATHYEWMNARKIQYGPAFLGVERIWVGTGEALARVRLPESAGDAGPYRVHPALLDACLQISAALFSTVAPDETFVPVEIERMRLRGRLPQHVWVRATLGGPSPAANELPAVNLAMVDDEGWPLLEIDGLRMHRFANVAAPDPFAGCAYVVAWQAKELAEDAAPSVPSSLRRGAWVIFVDEGGTGAAVARRLRAQGQVCIEVAAGSRFERREASHYTIDASKPQDYQRVFREVVSGDTVCRGVAHFWSLDAAPWGSTTAESLLADVRRGTLSALYVVQELVWQGSRDAPRLLLVTRGAQAAGGDASIASGSQAPLWGLGRTIAMEQPDLACTRVDLAPGGGSDEVAQVVREILSSDGEDQIAFRDDSRLVARLERGDIEPADAVALDPDATYLITGGLGGLGLTAARWMVSRGARHLMLLGRNNPTTTALEAIRVMEEAGARVRVRQVDVSRAPEVDGTLEYIEDNMPPLRGVVHAAGLIEDRTLQEMGEEQFSQPIRPKILGAWNLHRATRSIPLDFFVMYSSVAALLGSPGQGNYAAANAFLDALAHARVAEGLPAMSIQWGAFSEVGMVAEQESRGKRLAHRGIDSFTPDEGTELLSRLLQRPQVEVGLVRMSVRLWVEFYPRVAAMPFLAALREQEGRMSMSGALSPLRESLQDLSVAERRSALERHVLACLGRILRLAPERINAATPFKDYGMDSLMSLEIRNRLEPSLGLKLSAALLYTYPTAVALVDYLLIEMRFEAGGTADPADGLRASAAQIAVQLSEEAAAAMLNEKLLALEDYLK
jgi:acyl transferase domain-containing protein/acyl carrier protein